MSGTVNCHAIDPCHHLKNLTYCNQLCNLYLDFMEYLFQLRLEGMAIPRRKSQLGIV